MDRTRACGARNAGSTPAGEAQRGFCVRCAARKVIKICLIFKIFCVQTNMSAKFDCIITETETVIVIFMIISNTFYHFMIFCVQ